eukprot:gb/GFBE01027939.1/.p1 GENE.gb/GFBE01027939.1/~~gb/GFBE01027939.1/.p1  ORF type:complete len:190 (+),score=51.60 gb/GFBE01027939.1/:1-570(+)
MACASSAARRQPSSAGRLAPAAALLLVAAFSAQLFVPSFVPPPLPTEAVPAFGTEALRWLEATAKSELAYTGACIEEGVDSAIAAFEDLVLGEENDDVDDWNWNPQLVPAGMAPLPQQKDPVQQIIEPLTKLFMRYRVSMYPRCKDCQIVLRWGKLWRTCPIRKHKARQPGISKFKEKMNRFKGWRQIR